MTSRLWSWKLDRVAHVPVNAHYYYSTRTSSITSYCSFQEHIVPGGWQRSAAWHLLSPGPASTHHLRTTPWWSREDSRTAARTLCLAGLKLKVSTVKTALPNWVTCSDPPQGTCKQIQKNSDWWLLRGCKLNFNPAFGYVFKKLPYPALNATWEVCGLAGISQPSKVSSEGEWNRLFYRCPNYTSPCVWMGLHCSGVSCQRLVAVLLSLCDTNTLQKPPLKHRWLRSFFLNRSSLWQKDWKSNTFHNNSLYNELLSD